MIRRHRTAILAAGLLLVVASGTALATRAPRTTEEPAAPAASQAAAESTPGPEALAHATDRLEAAGISVDAEQLADLAGRYGLGGAVRVLAWADASGKTVDELTAMRDGDGTPGTAMGWGQIARELGLHPGIGSIMGNGGGRGRDTAPGQQGGAAAP